MRPGGFGVLLTQRLVDELVYSERGNQVTLIKYLDLEPLAHVVKTQKQV
jgi:anti-sigma regulatory factor (Ser/Thr protein kinase)